LVRDDEEGGESLDREGAVKGLDAEELEKQEKLIDKVLFEQNKE